MDGGDVRFYLSVLLRQSPLILLIALSVATISVFVAFTLPPVYRASAKILVEAPEVYSELAPSTVPANPIEQLQILQERVTTRANLLALADRLHLRGPDRNADDASVAEDLRSRMTFGLVRTNEIPEDKGATIFRVAFDDKDPGRAADVVNELTTFILDKNARIRASQAGETSDFIGNEAENLARELTAIEARILKFKTENASSLPEDLGFHRGQQQSAQERLLVLEREAATLRSRRDALAQMVAQNGDLVSARPMTLDQQVLQDLKRQLADQLAIFAESSPNISALRQRIDALEQRERDRASSPSGAADQKRPTSEADLQLFEADERLKAITQEEAGLKDQVAKLTAQIAATPASEAALNALLRTRESLQGQNSAVLKRLAEASTGRQIEVQAKGGRFSVVEPAVAPQEPISPNRGRIIGLGIGGGLALGLGLVLLKEMMNRTVRRPADIVSLLEKQPLVTIPYIRAGRLGRSHRMGRRHAAALAVGAMPAAHALCRAALERLTQLS